jgi:hypothetical protein
MMLTWPRNYSCTQLSARDGISSSPSGVADVLAMEQSQHRLRRPAAVIVATLAIFDVAYHLLLREPVRRMLGMRHDV